MLGELRRVLSQKTGLPTELIEETEAFLRRQATVVGAMAVPIKGWIPQTPPSLPKPWLGLWAC